MITLWPRSVFHNNNGLGVASQEFEGNDSLRRPQQSKVSHFLNPGDILITFQPPVSCCPIEVFKAYDLRQHEIMDRFRRHLFEQRLDMRTPVGFGLRRGEAMDQVPCIDWTRPRRIDRAQDEVDLSLGRIDALEGVPELAAQRLDVTGCDIGDLHFDARNPAIPLLADTVLPYSASGSVILSHMRKYIVTGLRHKDNLKSNYSN